MMTEVVNSLLVDFSAGSSSSTYNEAAMLRVEQDGRDASEGGLNVRSTPTFTDTFNLMVYSNKVSGVKATVSSGAVNLSTVKTKIEQKEYVTFDNVVSKPARYPIKNLKSATWLGTDLGTVTVTDDLLLSIATAGVGVVELVYESEYQLLQLTAPQDIPEERNEWVIAVVITGEEIVEVS